MAVVELSDEVRHALENGEPVLALESTIIAHGLPRPDNLAAARSWEDQVRAAGVTPATVAIVDGIPKAGLSDADLERIASDDIHKASVRDIPIVIGLGASGATTVASTAYLASLAGIRVFATGGLGGVHRGASESFDESADIPVLASTPITVVSAGVKSILDIAATLERLETYSVAVVGFQTTRFPAFWLRESPYSIDWQVESASEVAAVMASRDALGLRSGIVVANPVPAAQQWDPTEHDRILAEALAEAEHQGVTGHDVTPFLLQRVFEKSEGRSLVVNKDLVTNNVRVACDIAIAWSELSR